MLSVLPRRMQPALRWCVARRLLPFSVGAARTHGVFRRGWTDGRPVTFSEKLRYKLIHDRRPFVQMISDKVRVRDYVRSVAPDVQLPRLLGVHATEADVLAAIPSEPWVMKAAHGSGMVLLGSTPATVSVSTVRKRAREWLGTNYALRYWEWQYHAVPRRVIFEEHLGADGNVPADYKFYVIHQQVRLITVDEGRYTRHTRTLFRPDWTPIASRLGDAPPADRPPARPLELAAMIAAAERLACDADCLRVDLYLAKEGIYFGELTHAPAAGDLDFEDHALDAEMGSYWNLPRRYR